MRFLRAFFISPRMCLGKPLGMLSSEVCLPPMYPCLSIFARMAFSVGAAMGIAMKQLGVYAI